MPQFHWAVAKPPATYGSIDDSETCRHVRVSRRSTLSDVKKAILCAYEDQYTPDEITLFTRAYDDAPKRVVTDRVARTSLLSYDPDWTECQLGDRHRQAESTVLLIVSALNEAESELLVLPATHSAPEGSMLRAIALPHATDAGASDEASLVRRLAVQSPGLFDPLPLPVSVSLAPHRLCPAAVAAPAPACAPFLL